MLVAHSFDREERLEKLRSAAVEDVGLGANSKAMVLVSAKYVQAPVSPSLEPLTVGVGVGSGDPTGPLSEAPTTSISDTAIPSGPPQFDWRITCTWSASWEPEKVNRCRAARSDVWPVNTVV
jgi:hypothetical protein